MTHKRETLAVAWGSDDAYASLLGVSLFSFLNHWRGQESPRVIILDAGISQENKDKIASIAHGRAAISFVDLRKQAEQIDSASPGPWLRLFAPELVQDVDRLLYLDCDTLVSGDLSELFALDLCGKPFAMAYDCCRAEYRSFVGLPANAPYFNSGVILFDIAEWKRLECSERIFRHLREVRSDYPLHDQDALNVVLWQETFPLPMCYNFLSQELLFAWQYYCRVWKIAPENFWNKSEFDSSRRDVRIWHFSGQTLGRPWFSHSRHPMRTQWRAAADATPWRWTLNSRPMQLHYLVQYLAWKLLPDFLSAPLNALMQAIFMRKCYSRK